MKFPPGGDSILCLFLKGKRHSYYENSIPGPSSIHPAPQVLQGTQRCKGTPPQAWRGWPAARRQEVSKGKSRRTSWSMPHLSWASLRLRGWLSCLSVEMQRMERNERVFQEEKWYEKKDKDGKKWMYKQGIKHSTRVVSLGNVFEWVSEFYEKVSLISLLVPNHLACPLLLLGPWLDKEWFRIFSEHLLSKTRELLLSRWY